MHNPTVFSGESFGAPKKVQGELVFTTGMVGYTKTLTDPSYYGQILVFTFPLMGNYGVPARELDWDSVLQSGFESDRIRVSGVIVASHAPHAFHWRSKQTLSEWLKKEGIPGIADVDTRQLTQIIRSTPSLMATLEADSSRAILTLEGSVAPDASSPSVLPNVSCKERRVLGKGSKRVAVVDCGVKWNIIRHLLTLGCEVEVLPWDTDFKKVDCTAWLLSNGPGDPQNTGDLISRVRGLLEESRPVLGICLGYQLLALAAGAKTEKLKFGHRGHNHSVQLLGSQKGYMTSQNHGYVVIEDTLPEGWTPWFRHLNDGTLEGLRHETKPFRGVQFHPEAAAGPQDTGWILEEWLK